MKSWAYLAVSFTLLFRFDKNKFSDAGMRDILDALGTNETITRIQFGQGTNVDNTVKEQIQQKLTANEAKQKEIYMQRLGGKHKAPWKRSKLMVVGEGGAGKTATVRSLLNKVFDEKWDSTVGVSITETNASNVWTPDNKNGYAQTIAERLAVAVQEDERQKAEEAKAKRKKLAKRKPKLEDEGSSDTKEEEEKEEEEVEEEEVKEEETVSKEVSLSTSFGVVEGTRY